MKTVAEVMTRDVVCVSPDDTLQTAAARMDELNVGALPVCRDGRLLGLLTDRDIAVRACAVGLSPRTTRVDDVMTEPCRYCTPSQAVDAVLRQMGDLQIRRLPVLDDHEKLVGIVALGDLAEISINGVDAALRRISTPSRPDRAA
ncbi:MAG TPA: CBS domain-containing protein [Methylibium sp.]|uniref:CBS domain-containing protein n=1 Tax=Methylibium sp. TaxID=2067992 RepID=UPI002DB568D8|nr:CBS domain-containing protein [Methylibium sp.]HEU4459090.1 CBS domain-containing protein [Methylibium sp.]